MTVKRKSSGQVSPASTEVVSYTEGCPLTWSEDGDSPESPDMVMTSDEYDVVLEDVMTRKIIIECESSHMSLEAITYNMCQNVAITIMSSEWQKDLRHDIQRIEPHLK